MGLFTDIKNMKDTVRAGAAQSANPMVGAPGVVTAAELEPIAGVSSSCTRSSPRRLVKR
jgi:hypothetical protein